MSQARLPRTEPSTELITAHKVNNRDAHARLSRGGIFQALPKHRAMLVPNTNTRARCTGDDEAPLRPLSCMLSMILKAALSFLLVSK